MNISLKSQVYFFLTLLLLVVLGQVIFAKHNQSNIIADFSNYQQSVSEEKLVHSLEQDVLDLQRQVLIYKDSGSSSSVKRFATIITRVKSRLTEIQESLQVQLYSENTLLNIEAMQLHINDYDINFADVVEGRKRRDTLFEEGIILSIDRLLKLDDFLLLAQANDELAVYFYSAENIAYRYLLHPSSALKTQFSNKLLSAKQIIDAATLSVDVKSKLHANIDNIARQFIQLTNITQGYVYLVNVVMAGSANEFLYLSSEMANEAEQIAFATNQEIQTNIDNIQTQLNTTSIIAVLITLLLAFTAVKRIFFPLRDITMVFERLVQGEDTVNIPFTQRHDEIGKLASAANVFNQKNSQTRSLLAESQLLHDEQKVMNLELVEATNQAKSANASKSIFLANMSHEIRTPMNGIIGLIDITLQQAIAPKTRDNLERIAFSSQILLKVINDVLDFSKMEAGKLEIEYKQFHFSQLFDSVSSLSTVPAAEKSLDFQLFIDPSLPLQAVGDPLRLSQIILNLTNNAIKFTSSGSVKVSFWKRTSDISGEFVLEVNVQDTGLGMSNERLNKVFMPFTQGDNSTSRKFGGTGLGLSIVKQLTTLMSGEVSASSEINRGSLFTCRLPLKQQSDSDFASSLAVLDGTCVYLPCDNPLLYQEYLNIISPSQHTILQSIAQVSVQMESDDSVYLFDVESALGYERLMPVFASLRKNNKKFACFVTTCNKKLGDEISSKWHCPVLSPPYSSKEINHCIYSLNRDETIDALENSNPRDGSADAVAPIPKKNMIQLIGHVLVVEDNDINQMMMGEMLSSFGLSFDIAHNGEEAVSKVRSDSVYDIVLMDVQMPIMDGIEATKRIRENGITKTPIVGVSAHAMPDDHIVAIESGMTVYLTKPIRRETLAKEVSKLLTTPKHGSN